MKKLFVILLLLLLNSCFLTKENGIAITIKNSSEEMITEVVFATTEKLEVIKVDSLGTNETISKFLPMGKNKTDGAYLFIFTRANGKRETTETGYYTNGTPLEEKVELMVKNDTILIQFDESVL